LVADDDDGDGDDDDDEVMVAGRELFPDLCPAREDEDCKVAVDVPLTPKLPFRSPHCWARLS